MNALKKYISVLMLIFLAGKTILSDVKEGINIYEFKYQNKNYAIVMELKSWIDAAAWAVYNGGFLADINDADEQKAVYDAIINGAGISPDYISVPNGGGIAYIWIGATDQKEEGIWIWDGDNDSAGTGFWIGEGVNGAGGGSSVNNAYSNWGGSVTGLPNEPDNYAGKQHHAAIGLRDWPAGSGRLGKAGEWNDIIGSSELYFVVEY